MSLISLLTALFWEELAPSACLPGAHAWCELKLLHQCMRWFPSFTGRGGYYAFVWRLIRHISLTTAAPAHQLFLPIASNLGPREM